MRSAGTWWPFRPREDYPSTPGWLFLLILFAAIVVFVGLAASFGSNPMQDVDYPAP
jgi:hypothetical protein